MQAEFLAWLRGRRVAGVPDSALVSRHVEAEFPLTRRGEIVGWVDAVEVLDVALTCIVSLFEIKPVVDSPFGIIRQAKSYLNLARATFARADHIDLHIVVPASDPLLSQLRAEWPRTWGWGTTFNGDESHG